MNAGPVEPTHTEKKKLSPFLTNRPRQSCHCNPSEISPPPPPSCAMLRLRECVVSYIISLSSTSAVSPLLRLLSAAAAPVSPNPSSFAVEDYLIHTCGLTRPQALKASTKISHLKSPAKPNAVLAFLAGLGLSGADVAAVLPAPLRLLPQLPPGVRALILSSLAGSGLGGNAQCRVPAGVRAICL
ncbi:uncharacterized protein LOC125519229 [Triticum urartu]|uniref:uncharacterized protein LOC125519226 n=1 Tax=Triticum urartu TaxID=4572 RepID=UPI0020444A5A|nr:uncharacterized protein LOC125519226 [Triticum urartu]XP_048540055.1 uncharacterized protein LOC125519229 [Triticum urartu]